MKASQASRCACSELNSCWSPSSEDLRVYTAQRTLALRRVLLADLVIGRPLRRSKHSPLGQAKEARARPMRSGDPLGDHGQRAILLALILEPVLAHEDGVGVSAPLAH